MERNLLKKFVPGILKLIEDEGERPQVCQQASSTRSRKRHSFDECFLVVTWIFFVLQNLGNKFA